MLPSFKGAAYVYENIAMKFMTIEREEKPESDLVREKEKEKEQEKEDGEDKEEEKEKEKKKKKEEEEAEDEEVDEQKKIFRAWKLVDDYIEKKGADSLEQIVKLGLGTSNIVHTLSFSSFFLSHLALRSSFNQFCRQLTQTTTRKYEEEHE